MHMLLTSLIAIYQGQIPILRYGQHHADQLSRMHLRYALTREITPWIDNLITFITDPLNNEDPVPRSKTYNAVGTNLPESELARKNIKNGKLSITYKRLQQTNIPNRTTARPHKTSETPCKTSHKTTHTHAIPENTRKTRTP